MEKQPFETLELLKQIYKTLGKRPSFVSQLPTSFLPIFTAPQNQVTPDENVDLGLIQASDALMELAFTLQAATRPAHNKNNDAAPLTRIKELELLLGKLYAEKRFQDAKELEMHAKFKKIMEQEIRKSAESTKALEKRLEAVVQEKKRLEERLSDQARMIMDTSIGFDGELVNGVAEEGEENDEKENSQLFSIIESEEALKEEEVQQQEVQQQEGQQQEVQQNESEEKKETEVIQPEVTQSEVQPEVTQSEVTQSEVVQQIDMLTSTPSPFPTKPIADLLENHNANTLSSMSLLVQGFEQKLISVVEEIRQNVEKEQENRATQVHGIASEISELREEIREGTAGIEELNKSFEVLDQRLSGNFDELKTHFETVLRETLKGDSKSEETIRKLNEQLEFERAQSADIEAKRKRQLSTILELVDKLEDTLLTQPENTEDLTKFKAIQKKLGTAIQEVKQLKTQYNEVLLQGVTKTEKIAQLTSELSDAQKVEFHFLSTCLKSYSLIAYLFTVLIKLTKSIDKVGVAQVTLPAFINNKLPYSPWATENGGREKLEELIELCEREAPHVALALEDQLEQIFNALQHS